MNFGAIARSFLGGWLGNLAHAYVEGLKQPPEQRDTMTTVLLKTGIGALLSSLLPAVASAKLDPAQLNTPAIASPSEATPSEVQNGQNS